MVARDLANEEADPGRRPGAAAARGDTKQTREPNTPEGEGPGLGARPGIVPSILDCMSQTRTESDSMGPIEVPAEHYWAAQTQRSLHFFAVGRDTMPRPVIRAFGLLKRHPVTLLTLGLVYGIAVMVATWLNLTAPAAGMALLLVLTLLQPFVVAGLVLACRDLEEGHAPTTAHLLEGFRRGKAGALLATFLPQVAAVFVAGGLLAVISVFRAWTPGSNGLAIGWAGYATLICGALALCGVALVAHRGVYSLLVAFSFLALLLGLAAVLIYLPFASSGWGKLDSHFGTLARITGTSLDFLLLGPPLALIGFALALLASCVYFYANVVAAE